MIKRIQIFVRRYPELRTLFGMAVFIIAIYMLFVRPNTENYEISDQRCLELNSLWSQKYRAEFEFSEDFGNSDFECPSITSGIVQGLHLLETTRFHSQEGSSALDFYSRIKAINPKFETRPMLNLGGSAVFESNQITLNLEILHKNVPIEIANILVHEARHLEEGFNSHVKCRLDRERLCDAQLEKDPSTGGAYNHNILFLHQILEYSNADRQTKNRAKKLMQNIFDTRFNAVNPGDREKFGID